MSLFICGTCLFLSISVHGKESVVEYTPSKRIEYMLFVLIVFLVLGAALPILTFPLGLDQGIFAVIAQEINAGRQPYIDAFDIKPPAIFYLYAFSLRLFGNTTPAIRALDLLFAPLIMLLLFNLTRQLANYRAGLWAALFFGTIYFREDFWTLSQNDGLANLPMILAAFFAIQASLHTPPGSRKAMWLAALSGIFSAVTLYFKYPYVVFVAGLIGGQLYLRRKTPRRLIWREAAAFAGGGLLIGLGVLVYFASVGVLDMFIETSNTNTGYTSVYQDVELIQGGMRRAIIGLVFSWWWLIGLALLWIPFSRWEPRRPHQWVVIWLWLLAALVAVLMQTRGYRYHWLPLLAPLAILGGESIDRLLISILQRWNSRQIAPYYLRMASLLTLLLIGSITLQTWQKSFAYIRGEESRLDYYERFRFGRSFEAVDSYRVADYLEENLPEGQTVYIWAMRAEIYFLAEIVPPSRFVHILPLVGDWYPAEWREEFLTTLDTTLPFYFLVANSDVPVSENHPDSAGYLQKFDELYMWLQSHYRQETRIGNFDIWRLESTIVGMQP